MRHLLKITISNHKKIHFSQKITFLQILTETFTTKVTFYKELTLEKYEGDITKIRQKVDGLDALKLHFLPES